MKKIKAPDIQLSITGNSVQFTADKGWNVEFIGADFTQLVDDDLKVHTPLKDTSAALSFRCKKGSTVIEKDCTLQIKGSCEKAECNSRACTVASYGRNVKGYKFLFL